jgi:hypothetical protein
MPKKILDESVTSTDDGTTWDFQCPGVAGSRCGTVDGPPFTSTGWPSKKTALARGQEHFDEHKGNGPARTLEEFRKAHGLTVDPDGAVKVEDL